MGLQDHKTWWDKFCEDDDKSDSEVAGAFGPFLRSRCKRELTEQERERENVRERAERLVCQKDRHADKQAGRQAGKKTGAQIDRSGGLFVHPSLSDAILACLRKDIFPAPCAAVCSG